MYFNKLQLFNFYTTILCIICWC